MLSPVFSSQFKPALAPALQPVFALNKITRYIATLKASDGGYIKLAQPIELHAGDEVEWIGKTDYGSANRYLLDGHSSAYRCYVISGTNFSFNTGVISSVTFNDVVYTESFTNPNNGQVNSIKLTISAQCYIGTIGTSYTRVEFLDQAFLGLMVRRNGNVIHNISTDVAKGTTIIPNLAQPLGSELWNGVSTISNSSATSIATIETNELYLVNISEFTGNLQYASGAGWKQLRVGDNLISVTSGTSLSLQNFTQESTGVTFSVRKAPYWAEYINVTDDNKELYTWNAGRNAWIIEEPREEPYRLAPNFNGVDQYAEYSGKLVDVDNLDGLVLEGYFQPGDGTFFSQNTSGSSTSREFQIFELSGNVRLLIGGTQTTLTSNAPITDGVYRFEFLPNSEIAFYHNESFIIKVAYSAGTKRESTALFRVGARANGSPSSLSFFKSGLTYNIKKELVTQSGQSPIKTVVVFGASIMHQSFSGKTGEVIGMYAELGANVQVFEEAEGGDTTTNMLARLPNIIANLTDPTSTLFVIHWAGNDISQGSGYPDNAATIDANCRSMCNLLISAGCRVALSNTTYRIPPASNPSEPYNTNIMQPIINEFADVPMDLYSLTFNNQGTWFEPDGIHPSTVGEEMTREYIVNTTAQFIRESQANQTQLLNDWRFDDGFDANPQLKDYASGQDMEAKNFTDVTWQQVAV